MIVATPINAANSPTGMKPPPTVCHSVARAARRKKYAPPRYTDPSTIEVNPGTIRQANNRAVSSADGQKYNSTNATSRNGMITIDSTLVPGNTRSRATTLTGMETSASLQHHDPGSDGTDPGPPTIQASRGAVTEPGDLEAHEGRTIAGRGPTLRGHPRFQHR